MQTKTAYQAMRSLRDNIQRLFHKSQCCPPKNRHKFQILINLQIQESQALIDRYNNLSDSAEYHQIINTLGLIRRAEEQQVNRN